MPGEPGPTAERLGMGLARRMARWAPSLTTGRLNDPVFVVGFNNCGKSTAVRVLAEHPELLVYPGEGNGELWFPGYFPWLRSDVPIGPIWTDPQGFVDHVVSRRTDGFRRARAQLGAYQWLMRRPRILNDSGMLAALLPEVIDRFPEARVVHVVRHGALSSYLTARIEWTAIMRAPRKYLEFGCPIEFPSVLERMARYWAWTVERVDAVAASLRGRFLEVRYEDWCRDPEAYIERLAGFVGLEGWSPGAADLPRFEDLSEVILDEISDDERRILAEALGPTLAAKGYRL